MGHSTELVQSQVGNILKICMFYSQNFVRLYIEPYLKHTFLVKEPSIFMLYFQNVLECFSSPKNCHYRNIVIHYGKRVLLLTCSDCVSFPSLKRIYKYFSKVFTMKSIKIKFLPNFKVQFIQFILPFHFVTTETIMSLPKRYHMFW